MIDSDIMELYFIDSQKKKNQIDKELQTNYYNTEINIFYLNSMKKLCKWVDFF